MKKALFTYKKEDATVSNRELLSPIFVKESSNSIKDFEKPDVKYIQGYDFKKEGLSEEEQKKYLEALDEYLDWSKPSIKEFFETEGLDPKRMEFKTFKKPGVSELQILGD